MNRWRLPLALGVVTALASSAASAHTAFSCGGAAMLGGAQLLCSHTDPEAPTQICSFSWSLVSIGSGPTVVQGGFMLTPGQTNAIVYQGSGFSYALGMPIVLCQGRKAGG